MASVWVDIDLSEVDERDLINELESRCFNEFQFKDLIEMMYDEIDKQKMEFFYSIKDKYALWELKEIFKEESSIVPIPKEQLKLL